MDINKDIEIKNESKMTKKIAEAKAYKKISTEEEVGRIKMIVDVSENYYKLEYFRVKKCARRLGIGRKLLNIMIEEVRKVGGSTIIVYPKSEPYDGDELIEASDLYLIYEHLGFVMEDCEADRNRPNNKMIMKIQKVSD